MRRLKEAYGLGFFVRYVGCVAQSDACLLIGARGESVVRLDCSHARCEEMLEAPRRRGDALLRSELHHPDGRSRHRPGVCGEDRQHP